MKFIVVVLIILSVISAAFGIEQIRQVLKSTENFKKKTSKIYHPTISALAMSSTNVSSK